jgi:hypothetical protein
MAISRFSFSLDVVKDFHIIKWLETQPNLSAAVRQALLEKIETPGLGEIGHKLDRVLDALRNVQVVTPGADHDAPIESEPAAAVAGLDAMIGKFK